MTGRHTGKHGVWHRDGHRDGHRELDGPDGSLLLLMGVAGVGKTEVGRRIAQTLGWSFLDADDLHSDRSRDRMARGVPLTEVYRLPWLRRIRRRLDEHLTRGESVVLACSALRERHRRLLLDGLPAERAHVVHLHGARQLVEQRLRARRGHFFAPSLLDSQYETLEAPSAAMAVDVSPSLDEVVEQVLAGLRATP